jgi:hypothetical protein
MLQMVITRGMVCGRCRPAVRHKVAKFHVNNDVSDNQVIQRKDIEMKQSVAKLERHERTHHKTNAYKSKMGEGRSRSAPDGKT